MGGAAGAPAPEHLAGLIDGVAIAKAVRADAARRAGELIARGVRRGLTVILVGDAPASAV